MGRFGGRAGHDSGSDGARLVPATRVGIRATHVAEADTCYLASEAESANELAAVAHPVTGGSDARGCRVSRPFAAVGLAH
jgi:hypothetical protein